MKKAIKTVFVFMLSFVILLSCFIPGFAQSGQKQAYPYIFVHGLLGWGEEKPASFFPTYWGASFSYDLIKDLRSKGYEVYAPNMGMFNSVWDRTCELYAQLTGTVVDYGKAHSEKWNHEQYGLSFEGKPIMGNAWNLQDKLNLVGHSLGGNVIRYLAYLLAYGDEAEQKADPNCSELFKGGHVDCINSIVCLSTPLNGSMVSDNFFAHPGVIKGLLYLYTFTDLVVPCEKFLTQFGYKPGNSLFKNLSAMRRFSTTKDMCGYDMTMKGANEFNDHIATVGGIRYFSYTARATKPDIFGHERADMTKMFPLFLTSTIRLAYSAGKTFNGITVPDNWTASDGIVPLESAYYPFTEEHIFYQDGMEIQPGIWNVMPTVQGIDHFDFCDRDGFNQAQKAIDYDTYITSLMDLAQG